MHLESWVRRARVCWRISFSSSTCASRMARATRSEPVTAALAIKLVREAEEGRCEEERRRRKVAN